MSNPEHINSYIESLPNSCANAINLENENKPCSENTPSGEFIGINCPELTPEQLSNFCYYDSSCRLICPKNIDLTTDSIPSDNNSSIIDTFTGDFNLKPSKKYFDPKVFTYNGFINRFNENISSISYNKVHNSIAEKYNNIISYTPFKNLTQTLINDNNATIENLAASSTAASSGAAGSAPQSSSDNGGSSSSCSSSSLCFIVIGIALYFYMKNNTNSSSGGSSSDSSYNGVFSTDSSAPSV